MSKPQPRPRLLWSNTETIVKKAYEATEKQKWHSIGRTCAAVGMGLVFAISATIGREWVKQRDYERRRS